jgi:hypothetical protein
MAEWNRRVEESIRKERVEIEGRHGIVIGETDIRCRACGNPWSTFHVCSKMSPERKAEVECLKKELERPISPKTPEGYRDELGINIGMAKEQALGKFLEWQQTRKTCDRCEGEKYVAYCPVNVICKEAMLSETITEEMEESYGGDGEGEGRPFNHRGGIAESPRLEEVGLG